MITEKVVQYSSLEQILQKPFPRKLVFYGKKGTGKLNAALTLVKNQNLDSKITNTYEKFCSGIQILESEKEFSGSIFDSRMIHIIHSTNITKNQCLFADIYRFKNIENLKPFMLKTIELGQIEKTISNVSLGSKDTLHKFSVLPYSESRKLILKILGDRFTHNQLLKDIGYLNSYISFDNFCDILYSILSDVFLLRNKSEIFNSDLEKQIENVSNKFNIKKFMSLWNVYSKRVPFDFDNGFLNLVLEYRSDLL